MADHMACTMLKLKQASFTIHSGYTIALAISSSSFYLNVKCCRGCSYCLVRHNNDECQGAETQAIQEIPGIKMLAMPPGGWALLDSRRRGRVAMCKVPSHKDIPCAIRGLEPARLGCSLWPGGIMTILKKAMLERHPEWWPDYDMEEGEY